MSKIHQMALAALLAACLLCAACSSRRTPSETGESVRASSLETASSEAGESGPQAQNVPASSGEAASSTAAKNPAEDQELLRDILVNYGADAHSDRDGQRLKAHKALSLFQTDDWDEENPLQTDRYYIWNLGQLWNEDIPQEEKQRKYAHPLGEEGWFFPEQLYEERTTRYFDVTADQLRATSEYEAENRGYRMQLMGVGIGATPGIALYRAELRGDVLDLHLTLVYNPHNLSRWMPNEYKILSVRLLDGGGYKYTGYATVQDPPQEQVDAAFTNLQAVKTGQGAVYVSEELGFTVTFPANWADNYTAQINETGYQESEEKGQAVQFLYKGDSFATLLIIEAVPVGVWEQVQEQLLPYCVRLGENERYVFVAMPFGDHTLFEDEPNKALFDSMYIEKEEMGEKLKFSLREG